jgi:hypothetical protein
VPHKDPTVGRIWKKQYVNQRIVARRAVVDEIKRDTGCVVCGEREPVCIDFHHIDPATKTAGVAKLLRDNRSLEMILEEIRKCIAVCANCHRKIEAGIISVDTYRMER